MALRFAGLGFAAFLLRYHVAPQGRWPVPQRQLLSAVSLVPPRPPRHRLRTRFFRVVPMLSRARSWTEAATPWDGMPRTIARANLPVSSGSSE